MKKLLLAAAMLLGVSCATPPEPPVELGVMSFNMRYDRPDEGDLNWSVRRDRIVKLIAQQSPDIIGAQELLHHQYKYMDSVLVGYSSVGVARDDGKEEGEYNPVFFRSDRFTALDSGTFWLSETPDEPGTLGWDGACKRIATWALFKENVSGKEFLAVNTHLDHVGEVARHEGIMLLSERIEQLRDGRPAILTGDFNSTPDSEPVTLLLSQGIFVHTRDAAGTVTGPEWSFSDFGQIPEAECTFIDYIFTCGFSVISHERMTDTVDGGLVSDHAPVFARVQLEIGN